MRVRRLLALVCAVAVALTGAACTGDSSEPPPSGDTTSADAAAQTLADALVSGDFAQVGFSDQDQAAITEQYAATVEGMEGLAPSVTVAEVGDPQGDPASATATYDWTWPIGPDGWQYSTQVDFVESDGEWLLDWDPATVEPSLGESVTLDLVSLRPKRGDILGAGGLALVTNRPVVRIGIDRSKVGPAKAVASARDLARLVGVDAGDYAKRVEASGPLAFVEAIVYRQDEVPRGVLSGVRRIKGGAVIAGELPLAPTKGFAGAILGSVGEVTAEMIEDNPAFKVGDIAGLSGLQARYDEQLRGTPGQEVNAVGSDGKTRELFRVDAIDGKPLRLTMDERLQVAAEQALASVGPASALVAIKPSTGAILAAANGPGSGGLNIATYGQYAPGSTFKSVSSLALLRAGVSPNTVVPCTTSVVVNGKRFENYDDYPSSGLGNIALRTALANSCNTAFISQRGRLSQDGLVDAAASLGMGVDHDLGFPAYFGNVVPPAGETEKAADMIGQGKILASPMVMATVIASIQAGRLVVPSLVTSVTSPAPEGVSGPGPAEAEALRSMLRGVVTGGSGSILADVPGPPVIAKTGTAEYVKGGRLRTHAWMIAAQGDLAVAVFVEDGTSGSGTAGPVLEQFLRAAV